MALRLGMTGLELQALWDFEVEPEFCATDGKARWHCEWNVYEGAGVEMLGMKLSSPRRRYAKSDWR
jgi:hypothetical protein